MIVENSEYTFEKRTCDKCHKVNFCIEVFPTWYCEICFGWTKESAEIKDKVRDMMIQCGLEDLEN